jgi:hypothetical protein
MFNKISKNFNKRIFELILIFGVITLSLIVRYYHYPPKIHSLMCSFGGGRLGNQMSAFAPIYSYSQLYGYTHVVSSAQEINHVSYS